MAEKTLNTRISLKYDTLERWSSSSLILKAGEVAFATVPTVEGSTLEPVMFKVGDGSKTFAQLDWACAKAADVYNWAKAAGLNVDTVKAPEGQFVEGFAWENNKLVPKFRGFITEINEANKDKLDAPTTKAVKTYVDAEVQKAVSGGVEGLATEDYVDTAIENLSKDGGAIKAVADDLAEHEQAFANFQKTNTQAIADAKSGAETTAANALAAAIIEISKEIDDDVKALADGAVKANTDAIDAIEADYLKAADLNPYAKTADVPNIKVNNAGTADKVANALTVGTKSYDGSAAVEVTAADLGLESAMHFIGAFAEAPENHKAGDVYLNTATKKEYVYSDGWVELGDEGSYALRTVTITGNDGLTGGGDLTTNRTIGIADNGVTTAKIADGNVTKAKLEQSVQDSLALADSALQDPSAFDAAGAAAQALADAKADTKTQIEALKLGETYEPIGAETRAKDYADGLADNYDAAGSADDALEAAKKYTDDEITELRLGDINSLYNNFTHLAAIANSGNVNDLIQSYGDVLIFDCGGAE